MLKLIKIIFPDIFINWTRCKNNWCHSRLRHLGFRCRRIIEQDVVKISHRDEVKNLIRKGKDLEKFASTKPHVSVQKSYSSIWVI